MLVDPELEEKGLTVVVHQINKLHVEYNKEMEFPQLQRSCKIYTVFATRNRAPAYMAEYALNNCTSLVGVSTPFGNLPEILHLDIGLGPNLNAFEILPNFGLGEVI